jgi:hypothetical protein
MQSYSLLLTRVLVRIRFFVLELGFPEIKLSSAARRKAGPSTAPQAEEAAGAEPPPPASPRRTRAQTQSPSPRAVLMEQLREVMQRMFQQFR